MGENAAERGWHAQGTSDVRPELKRNISRRQRNGGAARRAAGRARDIPGIVGCAVIDVVSLPVSKHQRHIRLADDDSAGILQPLRDHGVFRGQTLLFSRNAPGGRKAFHIERLLDRHRKTQQRLAGAACPRRIGGPGGVKRLIGPQRLIDYPGLRSA